MGVLTTDVSPACAFYIAAVDAIGKSNAEWRKVADFADQVADIAVHRDDLYLRTFKGAARYKVTRADAQKPSLAAAETITAPSQSILTDISAA